MYKIHELPQYPGFISLCESALKDHTLCGLFREFEYHICDPHGSPEALSTLTVLKPRRCRTYPLDKLHWNDAIDDLLKPLYEQYYYLLIANYKFGHQDILDFDIQLYSKLREKWRTKFQDIQLPMPTFKLTTKQVKETKRWPKLKTGMIDAIATEHVKTVCLQNSTIAPTDWPIFYQKN